MFPSSWVQSKHPSGLLWNPSSHSLVPRHFVASLHFLATHSLQSSDLILLARSIYWGGEKGMKLNNKPTPNQQLLKRSQQGYSSKEGKSLTQPCSHLQSAIASSFLLKERVKWQMFLIRITASCWKILTLKMRNFNEIFMHAHSGSRHAHALQPQRHLSSQRPVPNSILLQESDLESVNLPKWPMLSTSPATPCLEKH